MGVLSKGTKGKAQGEFGEDYLSQALLRNHIRDLGLLTTLCGMLSRERIERE